MQAIVEFVSFMTIAYPPQTEPSKVAVPGLNHTPSENGVSRHLALQAGNATV